VKYKCLNCGEIDEKDVVWLIEDVANCTLTVPAATKESRRNTLSWENGFRLLRNEGILNASNRQLRR
jgi:hypothetical protein